MNAREFKQKHSKSFLAKNLPDSDIEIIIGSGLIAPNTKTSNLYKMMTKYKGRDYVVGGRAGPHANDGYWFAVLVENTPNQNT
jgi:hypothetical protein